MDFEERYKKCKREPTDIEKASCLFDVLYDISILQDHIQLAMPPINTSIAHSKQLTDRANAILLDVSKHKGNIDRILRAGYTKEKIDYLLGSFNNAVHDTNLTKDGDFFKGIKYKDIEDRKEPVSLEDRKKWKNIIFKDQDKL